MLLRPKGEVCAENEGRVSSLDVGLYTDVEDKSRSLRPAPSRVSRSQGQCGGSDARDTKLSKQDDVNVLAGSCTT